LPDQPCSPTAIELRFRDLMRELNAGNAACAKVMQAYQFLMQFRSHPATLDPWLLEIAETLIPLITHASFIGTDPAEIAGLREELALASSRHPEIRTLDGYHAALTALRESAARQYTFAGDQASALHLLLEAGADTQEPLPLSPGTGGSLLDHYRHAERHAGTSHLPGMDRWEALLDSWHVLIHETRRAVTVPVVGLRHDAPETRWAGLRVIRFASFEWSGDGIDHINASVPVAGVHETTSSTFSPAICAARSIAMPEGAADSSVRHISCGIVFDGADGSHTGTSANLGIAALAACRFMTLLERRESYTIPPGVAMTGGIDASGTILPVESTSLEAKVRAVFFSWVTVLAIPASQVALARDVLKPLEAIYPHRNLQLVGVGSLREIFYDRRLTHIKRPGAIRYLAQRIWRRKRAVAALVFAALLLTIARLWYGPIDKNAASWQVDSDAIVVRNEAGSVLDRIRISKESAASAVIPGAENFGRKIADIGDVDGDGRHELIWASSPDGDPDAPSVVFCAAPGRDHILWSHSLHVPLHFPNQPDVASGTFHWYRVQAEDYDGDGSSEVFIIARSSGFASILVRLDGRTGRESGLYVHCGHLNDMKVIDLDNDGRREIILCGVNNSMRAACLIALDPAHIGGYSPFAPGYEVDDIAPAQELAYVLIPRTIVGEQFSRQVKYNIAQSIAVHDSGKVIEIGVRDAFVNAQAVEDHLSSTVYVAFDRTFKPVGFRTGDDFDTLFSDFISRGKFGSETQAAYAREYVQKLSQQPWVRGTAVK
jgi:hypothetical protein